MAQMRDSPYGNLFGNMYASILFQHSIVNSLWEASQDKPLDLSNSKKKSSVSTPCKPSNITNSITLLPSKEHHSSLTPPLITDTIKPPEMKQLKLSVNNHNRPQRKMLPCEVCGKAFDRPSLLRRHMRTHTGEKPHVCDTCGKGFSTSSSLNTHRRIHSGEKPHECPICGKRFTASSNLYYHRMTHTKDKPHKCVICGKSFPTPGDLKAHAYVHTGNWPFKCSVCNRGFSKQTNMRNHMYLHTGDRSHISKGNGKVKE